MNSTPSISDQSLRIAILKALNDEKSLRTANLRVGVLNHIVHLAGRLDSLQKRTKAELIARQVHGVRGVVNRIEAPGAPSPGREINLEEQPNLEKEKTTYDKDAE